MGVEKLEELSFDWFSEGLDTCKRRGGIFRSVHLWETTVDLEPGGSR